MTRLRWSKPSSRILGIDPKKYNPRAILAKISSAKNEMILPADFRSGDYFGEIVKQVYAAYAKRRCAKPTPWISMTCY